MLRSNYFRAILVLLMAMFLVAAEDAAKSPEDIFKEKGLIKSGFMLIVPEEQTLHDAVVTLRGVRGKMSAAASKLRDADAQIKAAERDLRNMRTEDHNINLLLVNGRGNNQLIARHNLLLDDMRTAVQKLEDLAAGRQKLLTSRSDYITAVLDASTKADAALHAYDVPRADKELAGAIDKFNLTARPKVKLGPSAYFSEDLQLVEKCKADAVSGSIPITLQDGVPHVEVLINGNVPETMVWDSGCTGVCLSAKTAADLGLHPSARDPVVQATIADGTRVTEHVMMVNSIRIGPYTVQNLQCIVADKGVKGADLLGNEFQHHFQFKLDVNSSTLQLTPLDQQPASIKTAVAVAAAQRTSTEISGTPAVDVPATLPISGATPAAELASIKKVVGTFCRTDQRVAMPEDPIDKNVDWLSNAHGYSMAGVVEIGNTRANGHTGREFKGSVKAEPGFCLEGGTIDIANGEFELAGSTDHPCVLIGVTLRCEFSGDVRAANTVFENCTFAKAGEMYLTSGYTTKMASFPMPAGSLHVYGIGSR